jgi:DNA helicase-2/ATP-dependent DNA helicase PcrA
VLHVNEGTFPNEFATGKAELIDEERRLLYVAVTRAKQELHLVSPLRYYVTQQTRQGDVHVYGTRSRFLTAGVMSTLDAITWPPAALLAAEPSKRLLPRVDVAARLRNQWA